MTGKLANPSQAGFDSESARELGCNGPGSSHSAIRVTRLSGPDRRPDSHQSHVSLRLHSGSPRRRRCCGGPLAITSAARARPGSCETRNSLRPALGPPALRRPLAGFTKSSAESRITDSTRPSSPNGGRAGQAPAATVDQ